ncbi:MAG: ABC transporter substrate-binding protein, partial [Tateyamaria sp.]|uniref:ABC transporter substrate-binding protein n=1 Tax=Tateyamaria sp. TaxID=1929288 RepID=UPI0032DDCC59
MTKNMNRRQTLAMLGLTGAAWALAPNLFVGPALAAHPEASTGQIVVGVSQEPTVFNPLMPRIEVDDGVQLSVFDGLVRISPEGEFIPALAAEVPSIENGGLSEDGLNWHFKLRDDVTWHDGEPFTAEDVKFTLELIMDPNFRSWRTTGHELVRDIEVVSPTEIKWRMEEPFAPYMSILVETMMVPKHILEPLEDRNEAPFNQAPVGTGAFKWGSRKAGDHVELVANSDYFGEGPYVERLIFKYIPDLTV